MEKGIKVIKVFVAILVLAGLIFAGTQSQDVFTGWAMGLLGVVNGIVLLADVFKK